MELYRKDQISASEQEWRLCDDIDGMNWTSVVSGREFVFFPGLDSPGGDYLVVAESGDIRRACLETHHCIAYNTNGILKHSLLPPPHWHRWTDDPQHGLYVLDIDYCQLWLETCPTHSHCVKLAPANYSCQCLPNYHTTRTGGCELKPEEEVCVISMAPLCSQSVCVCVPDISGSVTGQTSSCRTACSLMVSMATHNSQGPAESVRCSSGHVI